MSSLYSTFLRPLLFRLDPERAHALSVEACRMAGAMPLLPGFAQAALSFSAPELQVTLADLHFDNPVGLAAGWDKSGRALRLLDHLGFGFVEIGSVSARPSHGNPKPRLFRLPNDRAIVVNYGVPNDGAETVARRIALHRLRVPLGVNVVSTNPGPGAPPCSDDEILEDYEFSVSLLHRHCNYLMLNLSCPNAKDGQDFFARPGSIARLLGHLRPLQIKCPVFLKFAPHEQPVVHDRWLAEVSDFPFVRGFMFNLPAGKPDTLQLTTPRSIWEKMPGAASGRPVEALMNRCISTLYQRMDRSRYIIIGAGGIFTAEDAYRKIRLGASLVQVYTALVYEGPGVVGRINRGLLDLLKRDGFRHVQEAVGAA